MTQTTLIAATVATKDDIRESEARWSKDMEMLRQEVKGDVEVLRKGLKNDMELMRSEFESEMALVRKDNKIDIEGVYKHMAQLKYDLIKWMVGIGFTTLLAFTGLLKYMR